MEKTYGVKPSVPRFSLVIPTHNEEFYLPRLLDSIEKARDSYDGNRDSIEVIVADNASSDATVHIALARGCRVVSVEKRNISAARNGGAHAARGEMLAFVDADTQIHPGTFNEIDRALATDRVIAGATGIRFERQSLGLTITYAALVLLTVVLGRELTRDIPTGVLFCRRSDFEMIGGYNEERFYAEDVQIVLDLKRLGRRRGQRFVCGMKSRAIFSTRKFDRYGDWHYFAIPFRLAGNLVGSRSAIPAWARRYWYEDQ